MIRRNLFSRLVPPAAVPAVSLIAWMPLAFLLSGPALAGDLPAAGATGNGELQACVKLAEMQPAAGLDGANAWEARGGGDLARLCAAMALFHKGDFAAAGRRLEDLVPALGRDDAKAAASLLARAGWAWLRAGDNQRADRLYGQALDRQPGDVDLLIDRAIARAEGERYWDAVTDLDAALKAAPTRADAWLYRAAAHKALGNHALALDDVAEALVLKPADPEALLLRGNLKALRGDAAGARADWKLVVRQAPGTTAADTAGTNLDRLSRAEAALKAGAPAPSANAAPAAAPVKP